jgi:beta-fructofuranosidase
MATDAIKQTEFGAVRQLFSNPTATFSAGGTKLTCGSRSGYEIFSISRPSKSFIWEGTLSVEGMGKLGLVSDVDAEGSGYFISFDVKNGLVQIRSWGFNPVNSRQNFIFSNIQSGIFSVTDLKSFHFRLIRYGHYIELSINGIVKLTLIDYTFTSGDIGLYSASSVIALRDSTLSILPDPEDEYASQQEAAH